jgi:signal transduction histidine kinase
MMWLSSLVRMLRTMLTDTPRGTSPADHTTVLIPAGEATDLYEPAETSQPDRAPRPRAGWRQVGPDLGYLLPGLPIAIVSFTVLVTGFWLGVGLVPLALLGLFVLTGTLAVGRGFAAAERKRIEWLERRSLGPVYYRQPIGSGFGRLVGPLRDRQLWRDFGHGVLVLPVRVITWSVAVTWVAGALGITYPLWAWSIPRGTGEGRINGLAELVFGWEAFAADVALNTALAVPFLLTLPYVLRGLAVVESGLARSLLTNQTAALRARAEELSRSRQAVVRAEAETLRRVERDLHDGPQQRLVRLTMDLKSAQRRLSDDPAAAAPLIDEALAQSEDALAELRALSRGIAPPILTDRGLVAAVAAAGGRSPIPVVLDLRIDAGTRLPAPVEHAAYFVVTEALANAAKHSGASRCEVSVSRDEQTLTVRVSDDGGGGAHLGKGHGLAGLADRLAGVYGRLQIDSSPGAGTTITATIPTDG